MTFKFALDRCSAKLSDSFLLMTTQHFVVALHKVFEWLLCLNNFLTFYIDDDALTLINSIAKPLTDPQQTLLTANCDSLRRLVHQLIRHNSAFIMA